MKTNSLIWFACLILAAGCNKPANQTNLPLTPELATATLSGSYTGIYAGGIEYFEIRTNGLFSQTFVRGGATNYISNEAWRFEQRANKETVSFEPFMDLRETIVNGKPPKKSTGWEAVFYPDEGRIYFSRDLAYFITKRPR